MIGKNLKIIIIVLTIIVLLKKMAENYCYEKINNLVKIKKYDRDSYYKYILNNIPFYKKLKSFPIIEKKDIREDPTLFYNPYYSPIKESYNTAANNWGESNNVKNRMGLMNSITTSLKFLNKKNCLVSATGGSSGKSFYQLYNNEDMMEGAIGFLRCLTNMGFDPKKHKLLLLYVHGNNFVQILYQLQRLIPRFYSYIPSLNDNCDMDDKIVTDIYSLIEDNKIDFVITFPSTLFRYCEKLLEKGLRHKHNPIGFDLSADFLLTCQYKFICDTFPNSKVRMSYGTVETGQIAQQYTGDNHLVYKVFDDICDVKNNNSNLVITKFNYKVMPLVNYMVDDYCEVIKTQSGIFLRNLVGKKHKTDNTNIIQLDKRINMANKMVNNNIINLYYIYYIKRYK